MVGEPRPTVLAIVPARGGSRSLPRKNLRLLAGHPLIAYSIVAGQEATSVTRLIVSTDDEEIAEVSMRYGAEVPFLRPAELAEDLTPDLPVFQHALSRLREAEGYDPDIVVQLRPTAPLRPPGKVDEGIRLMVERPDADCVRSVTKPGQNPYKMWKPGDDGLLRPLLDSEFDEPYNMPRQALPETYWQTGHIDVIRVDTIRRLGSLTGRHVLPIPFDPLYCIDIDYEWDLEFASWLITSGRVKIVQPHEPTERRP